MKTTINIINEAMATSRKACLAFSGGSDSVLLLDIVYKHTNHRPLVIFADSQMEYPETEAFCREVCGHYQRTPRQKPKPTPNPQQTRPSNSTRSGA